MTCSANVARFTATQAAAAFVETLKDCAIWRVPYVSGVNHSYFHSSIPSLLVPGAYDPTNSPDQESALAGHLTHSKVMFFPMLGHDVVGTKPCQDSVVQAFLSNPNRRPDTSCMAEMYMPWQ